MHQIGMVAGGHQLTVGTGAAGHAVGARLRTHQSRGQHVREMALADPSRPGQEHRMAQSVVATRLPKPLPMGLEPGQRLERRK